MTRDSIRQRRRRRRWYVHGVAYAGAVAAFAVLERTLPNPLFVVVAIAILAVAVIRALPAFVERVRERSRNVNRASPPPGQKWPLGLPYHVELDEECDGSRRWNRLRIDESTIEFRDIEDLGDPLTIHLADVTSIRTRASWIEIAAADETCVRVVPGDFADRQRLLWELAVRVPDAFEFATAETGPTVPVPPPEPVDLTHTPTGLASALAGPDRSANPPPRNAGLGCGLFPGVAPAEDDE